MERAARTAELLDGPLAGAADDLAGNLADLRRVNRLLWGRRLSMRALEALLVGRAPRRAPIRLVDVGTGAADIPAAIVAAAARHHRTVTVVAVDSRPEVLDAAVRIDPSLAAPGPVTLRLADGRRLPFEDGAFDVAHASLVIHHLEPRDAVALLSEMRRVARLGIVVNDLLRSRRAYLGARLLVALTTRNRLTRHDAPLSVRRAYTEAELRALLSEAGVGVVARAIDPLGHRVALAAVPGRTGPTGPSAGA